MVLWTSDKYITSIKKLPLVKNRHSSMEVMLKPTIRTNIHICVPVFLVCPILGLIWVLSSYISSAMGVIFVYNRTNMYICVPVMILCPIIGLIWVLSSYISSAMSVLLVYSQYVLWASVSWLFHNWWLRGDALWYSTTLSAASDAWQKSSVYYSQVSVWTCK